MAASSGVAMQDGDHSEGKGFLILYYGVVDRAHHTVFYYFTTVWFADYDG